MCRVLVVDEDPSVVALCLFALEFEGHQAMGFTGLPEALDAVGRETFDVVVVELPADGETVFSKLDSATSGARPILLLAEDSLRLFEVLMSTVRPDVYGLTKPFDIGEFVDEVQRLAHAA
jgi:DNA-binding response OmpR family regulator